MAAEPDPEILTAYGGLALLPFFKACRAGIRAKVGALALRGQDLAGHADELAEARAYLALAIAYLTEAPPARLIAVGGLSGSGKSTLAWTLAARLGAVVLRSDVIRKGFWAVDLDQRLPQEAYAPEVSTRVYAEMRARAAMALAGGAVVILDAAHFRESERAAAAEVAAAAGVPFHGFWLDAAPDRLKARVDTRARDASDAGVAAVETQLGYDLGQITWQRISADGTPDAVAELAFVSLAQ